MPYHNDRKHKGVYRSRHSGKQNCFVLVSSSLPALF
ncbi:hypothetical protein S7335_4409 [Synechococcus sp. PCC 7335]|nr:hypothetical protein S7335_4409 [Synechococcus sp. PCC 7335]